MKKFYLLLLVVIFLAHNANAAVELTALKLQEYCAETDKGFAGKAFDSVKSETCRGYMMGFFDSIILIEQLVGKASFCIPQSLPKANNNTILNSWVMENKGIADTTTASVALYSAYSKAFPCK